jgi:hypothetical protein
MKRSFMSISLAAIVLSIATAAYALPAKHVPKRVVQATRSHRVAPAKVAPADEYFGRLRMSVLGIRNTISDVGANIDIDQARWPRQANKIGFAEDAIRDWQHKYPKDSWLPKSVFSLERMYARLDSDEGRTRSLITMQWLVRDFPGSWYGRTGKMELDQGRVGHPVTIVSTQSSPSRSTEPNAVPDSSSVTPVQTAGAVAPTPMPNP